jgi:hypothetical protein
MNEFITTPWPWYVAGPLICLVMVVMLFFGKQFGISSTMRTVCAIGGAGKLNDYFNVPWRDRIWNLVFALGAIIGGFIASTWMQDTNVIDLNANTVEQLQLSGIDNPGSTFLPPIFSFDNLFTFQGMIMMVLGGFLVGFGTRYAEGCTSGHAISGLSNLQLPSLIAVIGFFVGGLVATHYLLPILL